MRQLARRILTPRERATLGSDPSLRRRLLEEAALATTARAGGGCVEGGGAAAAAAAAAAEAAAAAAAATAAMASGVDSEEAESVRLLAEGLELRLQFSMKEAVYKVAG